MDQTNEETNQEEGVAECDAASDAGMSQPETDVLSFEEKEGQEGKIEKEKIDMENMKEVLELSQTELVVLSKSWDMLMTALGGERETVGDAIFGALSNRLTAIQEAFKGRPRAIISLNLFNGFRLLCEKAVDPQDLKIQVETLAFKHLGNEITQQRVDGVTEAFLELMQQNVAELPPGAVNVWQKMLTYTGSCCRYISATYTDRLKIIQEDWAVIQSAQHETESNEEEKVTRSFGGMCAFSNEVIGQPTEGWMEDLLLVFSVLVERIGNPSHLMEECELLAINFVAKSKSKSIDFDKFKPVMLAALRSLLPKTWSTTHETAWEWLWATISRNLSDSSSKVRAFKVYNAQLFGALKEEHLNTFRNDLYTDFFAKCAISQDIFKQSQTRLHYIADRVLQSSYDMFHKPKQEMVDELSALGLRHVGYGVPIELFAPFTDSCVQVIKTVAASMPKSESTKIVACAVAGMTQAEERDVPEHMMVEGFRWSIGLVARLLMRIITEGSTAVMQAIYQDSAKLLQAALKEAPREYRNFLQLRVRVGSQSISPLYWALRSGAHTAARTMLEDVLTIRADRDRYYYGVNDIFKFQPDIAADLLQEAPKLVNVFLDGLIWRSHKTKEGQRPVVYYMEHLLQDPDDEKMISRAFVSFVRFRNPKIIVHPILIFVSDLVWNKLVRSYFMYDQIFRMINFVIFILAGCFLNQPTVMRDPVWSKALVGVRVLVYTMGFAKLLYSHVRELYRSSTRQDWKIIWRVRVPTYLLKGPEMLSFMLMLNMASMMVVEPMIHCFGTSENFAEFQCENWTDDMSLAYEVFLVIGIFLYVFLIFGIGSSISIEISEYRVLCMSAVKQVALCLGVVTLAIFTFGFVITAMTREIGNLSSNEFMDVGSAISNLARLAIGMMDTGELRNIAEESPFLLIVISMFMLLVCSFFFNILVSQFCGVYSSLAEDSEGHARLSRGEVILDTLKAVQMKQWKSFVDLLALDQRTDFDEGDIGLAGGVKIFEPAGANPKTQDQIIRFGGATDPSLPWPERNDDNTETTEKMIQRTIAHSLKKLMKGSAKGTESDQTSSVTKNSSVSNHSD